MGNCCVLQREITWLDDEEEEEERWELLEKPSLQETEKTTEVKIRISKKQLKKFLSGKNKLPLEEVLEEIVNNGVVCYEHNSSEGHWKPRLQSIPEVVEERLNSFIGEENS